MLIKLDISFESKHLNPEVIEGFNILPFHVYWKDVSGHYLGCNVAQAKTLGLPTEHDIIGCTDDDLLKKQLAKEIIKNDNVVLNQHTSMNVSERINNMNGIEYNVISYKIPLLDINCKTIGIIGFSIPCNSTTNINQPIVNISHYIGSQLSIRQSQCLYYLLRGHSSNAIANILKLSKRTVESYTEEIKIKLGCHTRQQIIDKSISLGYASVIPAGIEST